MHAGSGAGDGLRIPSNNGCFEKLTVNRKFWPKLKACSPGWRKWFANQNPSPTSPQNAAPQWRCARSFGAHLLRRFSHAHNKSGVYCLGTPLAK
jgi:hypothetical protein